MGFLREEIAQSDLLPRAYARYRPVLADALCFFLRRISRVRLGEILGEQMAMPELASAGQRLVALLVHVPALHKLGQVVARDRRLAAGFRRKLQQLESLAPRMPGARVERLLDGKLKSWRKAGIRLGLEALAEGSVAIVMPFERQGRHSGPRHGVFKVLKPGVAGKLDEDLEILSALGGFLDEQCDGLGLPALDYRDTFNTLRDLLLHEVRLEEEQQNLAEARVAYGSMESILIPRLFPFCSSKVTAMERIWGGKITEVVEPPLLRFRLRNATARQDGAARQEYPPSLKLRRAGEQERGKAGCSRGGGSRLTGQREVCRWVRESLARDLVRALIAQPMFSSASAALFHADPHAGNLLLTSDCRIGVIDWSLTGHLAKSVRIELIQLLVGALMLDAPRMLESAERLSEQPANSQHLRKVLEFSLGKLRLGTAPGLTWLTQLLDDLVLHAGLRPEPNLMLFRKTLLTLAGVVADITGAKKAVCDAFLDETVMASFVSQGMAEWPARFVAGLTARSFSTHLSNADLAGLFWSAPMTVARLLVRGAQARWEFVTKRF